MFIIGWIFYLVKLIVIAVFLSISTAALSAESEEAARIIKIYDKNNDRRLDQSELAEFLTKEKEPYKSIDGNQDGVVTADELKQHAGGKSREIGQAFGDTKGNLLSSDIDAYLSSLKRKEPEKDFLDTIVPRWLKLRKSYLTVKDEGQPAQFSWTQAKSEKSFFTVDSALQFEFDFLAGGRRLPKGEYDFSWQMVPTVEAHVSSNPKAQQDSVSYRALGKLIFAPVDLESALFKSHYFAISPVWETDRRNRTQVVSGEAFWSPTIPGVYLGQRQKLFASLPVSFIWRPYLGFEFGHVSDDGGNMTLKKNGDFGRFLLKMNGSFWFTEHAQFSADLFHRVDLEGESGPRSFGEISQIFYLDAQQRLSLGVTYKNGRTTPKFTDVNSVNLWFGLKL